MMVSESEYDGNQEEVAAREPTLAEQLELAATGRFPKGFAGLSAEVIEGLQAQLTTGKLTAAAIMSVGLASAVVAASSAATTATGVITEAGKTAGKSVLTSVPRALSGAVSGTVGIIVGQNMNLLLTSLGVETGKLKTTQEWLAFTTPVFDPVTGKWDFPADTSERLRTRMKKAGMNTDDIEIQLKMLDDNRRAMTNLINDVGTPGEDFEVNPGETELEAAKRVQSEKQKAKGEVKKAKEQDILTAQKFRANPNLEGTSAQQTQQSLDIRNREAAALGATPTLPASIGESPADVRSPLADEEERTTQEKAAAQESRAEAVAQQLAAETPEQRAQRLAPVNIPESPEERRRKLEELQRQRRLGLR